MTETVDDPYISYEGLCGEIAALNPDADITPQALEQRINTPECAAYVKTAFEEAMREKLPEISLSAPELLRPFENVYLEDSAQASVHEKPAGEFKGSGGCASAAAAKSTAFIT